MLIDNLNQTTIHVYVMHVPLTLHHCSSHHSLFYITLFLITGLEIHNFAVSNMRSVITK